VTEYETKCTDMHNTETVQTMLKQFSRHIIHSVWMHTGLAHAPCILQDMCSEVAWTDEALSLSFMTCYTGAIAVAIGEVGPCDE